MPPAVLQCDGAGQLDSSGVESGSGVESIGKGIDISEAAGESDANPPDHLGSQPIPLVTENPGRGLESDPEGGAEIDILLAGEAGVSMSHQELGSIPAQVRPDRAGDCPRKRPCRGHPQRIIPADLAGNAQSQIPRSRRSKRPGI